MRGERGSWNEILTKNYDWVLFLQCIKDITQVQRILSSNSQWLKYGQGLEQRDGRKRVIKAKCTGDLPAALYRSVHCLLETEALRLARYHSGLRGRTQSQIALWDKVRLCDKSAALIDALCDFTSVCLL